MMDSTIGKAQKVDKPWGFELIYATTDEYAGKLLFIRRGERLSLHYHKSKDESMYIYKGKVLVQLGEGDGQLTSRVLGSGACLRIEPRTVHRVEAVSNSIILEVSTPRLDDVHRLDDDYGRRDRGMTSHL